MGGGRSVLRRDGRTLVQEHVMACMCVRECVTGRWEYEWGLGNNRSGLRLQFHASREQTIKKERRAHQAHTLLLLQYPHDLSQTLICGS